MSKDFSISFLPPSRYHAPMPKPKTAPVAPPLPPVTHESGAPSALKWIAEQEVSCRAEVDHCKRMLDEAIRDEIDNPPEKDGTDYTRLVEIARRNLGDATDRVQKWQKSLRDFDRSITPERRDSTERITREEGEKQASMLAIAIREAAERLITGLCQDVLNCKRPEDVHLMLAEKLRESFRGAIDSACREGHLPGWYRAAIGEVL